MASSEVSAEAESTPSRQVDSTSEAMAIINLIHKFSTLLPRTDEDRNNAVSNTVPMQLLQGIGVQVIQAQEAVLNVLLA